MITNVPIKIMEASRTVALRHPNSIDCVVFRKALLAPAGAEEMGGLPTLGGMGVLKNEDDPEFEYRKLGYGKILVTGRFDGSPVADDGESLVPDQPMQEAQIVSVNVGEFEPQKGDLVGMLPGGGVLIGFEIIDQTGSVAIYPYVTKWVIAPRDELHDLTPWTP